jgi:AMP-polyphosphate phosphotransferase
MLELIDLDRSVPKTTYDRRLPRLQTRLYDLERAVSEAGIPVAIAFEGWAAAGKAGAIRTMTARLDPRGSTVVPILPPRTLETQFPWLHRFWLKIPAHGQMVIFDTSWYRRVLIERIERQIPKRLADEAYQDVVEFEETLAADGTVIVKFWLHITASEQGKRFKALLKDPITAWQVTDEDRTQHRKYARYLDAVEEMFVRTDTAAAPWVVVEATDRRFARLKIMETTVATLEAALAKAGVNLDDEGGAAQAAVTELLEEEFDA